MSQTDLAAATNTTIKESFAENIQRTQMIIYNAPYFTDTFNYVFGPEPVYNATDMYIAESFSKGANKTKQLSLFKGDL